MMDRGFFWVALACYAGATLLTARRLRGRGLDVPWRHANFALMLAGFVLHTLTMALRGQHIGRCPLTNLYEVQVFVTWAAVLFYLLIGPSYRVSFLGAFTAPVVLVIGLVAQLAPIDAPYIAPLKRSPWVETHAAIAILAFGAFALSFVTGTMYLVQERQLKSRRPTPALLLLPAIGQLDVIGFRLLVLGFTMYTAGMVGGIVSTAFVGQWGAAKTMWASGVWLLYGVLLAARGFGAWRGRRFAVAAIAGFAVTIAGLWGASFLSP